MATQAPVGQQVALAREARKRLLADAGRVMLELGAVVDERLSALMDEAAPSREMSARRDAWTLFQSNRKAWIDGTVNDWQDALKPAAPEQPKAKRDGAFELVGTEEMEHKILASRLALGVIEKAGSELVDLQVRIKHLEDVRELDRDDILKPEALLVRVVERWSANGMTRDAWLMVCEAAETLLSERLKQAYASSNAFLIKQGVLPTIELADRVKRAAPPSSRAGPSTSGMPVQSLGENHLERQFPGKSQPGGFDGGDNRIGSGTTAGARLHGASQQWNGHEQAGSQPSGYSSASDETRMVTRSVPLLRARSRALGVVGQLKRLLIGSAGASFDATSQPMRPSPALAAAIAVSTVPPGDSADGDTVLEYQGEAGVARVAGDLRRRTQELKDKAETKSEKALIEVVALMFQAILQEDRIPPAIRVWFARLQMPVLRVAMADPDFFGTLDHPARQLIDRMGSCVMGFDASGINGSALETEIKRVVQVIEQYPETGKRVYQLVYEEFQKFLGQFLTDKVSTQKVLGVAQQVEQKETLTIQYTIEMRNMLKDMPVSEAIRRFLFKVWAEVLAVAAVRKGPRHAQTLALKQLAADLVWAASAKPNRADRARVIADLPQLLQKLRAGMTLLGVAPLEQETYIKTVNDTLADAFVSKTQAIPAAQIATLANRLANLEDFVDDEGAGDLPLDAQSIEMMLGIDASDIDVVTDGGSKPTAALLAWAQQLQVGSWFTLDHNGRVAQVQFVWRSERRHLNLFASTDGRSYLIQAGRLAAYLQAGLLIPEEQETLTVRATRDALVKLSANPERLLS